MSYEMGSYPVPNASTVAILTMPNLSNANVWTNSATPIYLGTSTKVSPTSGVQCPTLPTNIFSYVNGAGATIYAANTSASTINVNFSMVTGS